MGSETILVVEDDDALRIYVGKILRGLGYQVIEAKDGAAALDTLRTTSTSFSPTS